MKKRVLVVMLALCMCLTGCRTQELQLFTIVIGIAVDRADGLYSITIESSGKHDANSKTTKPQVSTGTGKTMPECFSEIQKQTGKSAYLRHTVMLAFSVDTINESLENVMNYIINEHNIRLNTRVTLAEGKAGELFDGEEFQSERILRASTRGGTSIASSDVMLEDFVYNLYAEGVDAHLPITSPDKTEGIALFSGFKYAGRLDGDLTAAYLMVRNLAKSGHFIVEQDGRPYSLRLMKNKCHLKTRVEGGSAVISIDLDVGFRAEDRLLMEDSVYERALEQQIKEDVETMLQALKESGSDAIGAGQYLHRHNNKKWQEVRDDWGRMFAESRTEINVKATVDSNGKIKEDKG